MLELLKKYLAPFVVVKDTALDILTVLGEVINDFYTTVTNLKSTIYTSTSIKKQLDDLKIFYLSNNTDEELQAKFQDWENILTNRGTEAGVTSDLLTLPNIDYSIVKGWEEAGEIVADINPIDDLACCLDLHKVIIIHSLEGFKIDQTTREIISQYIIPIEIKPIFVEH